MLVIDLQQSQKEDGFLETIENVRGFSSSGCNIDRNCLPSETSQYHHVSNDEAFNITFIDDNDGIDFFHLNEKHDINAQISTASAQHQDEYFSSSSKSTPRLHIDNLEDIHNNRVHTGCMYLLHHKVSSQDDCVNSVSHPKLFKSRYQQAWNFRSHKFQLGLINTREQSGHNRQA
jgi:hypothetical protein